MRKTPAIKFTKMRIGLLLLLLTRRTRLRLHDTILIENYSSHFPFPVRSFGLTKSTSVFFSVLRKELDLDINPSWCVNLIRVFLHDDTLH